MSITRSCSALPFAWEDLDEAELGGNLSWFEPSNHFGRLLSYRSSDAFGKVPGWLWVMSDFWKRPPQTQILPKKALSFCCSFVKTSQSWKMFHLLRALPGSRQLWSPFYPLVTLVWSCVGVAERDFWQIEGPFLQNKIVRLWNEQPNGWKMSFLQRGPLPMAEANKQFRPGRSQYIDEIYYTTIFNRPYLYTLYIYTYSYFM